MSEAMLLRRRSFLRMGVVAAGAAAAGGLVRYAEPLTAMRTAPGNARDWIEDCGDYAIIRVPGGKTFAKERISKPTIWFLGDGSIVMDCALLGMANVCSHNAAATWRDNYVDASRMVTGRGRAVINVESTALLISGGEIVSGPSNDYCLKALRGAVLDMNGGITLRVLASGYTNPIYV